MPEEREQLALYWIAALQLSFWPRWTARAPARASWEPPAVEAVTLEKQAGVAAWLVPCEQPRRRVQLVLDLAPGAYDEPLPNPRQDAPR